MHICYDGCMLNDLLKRQIIFIDNETKKYNKESMVALNTKQKRILTEAKAKLKVMGQIARLEKEISSLRKKLEMKESKVSDLINILDEQNNPDDKSSVKSRVEKRKPENPSALFAEG